ncbi:MAG TPA: hypothetical protein VLM40_10155, partial [Gemmata sp.]|nr:hypothetical protein [Gemmata sp.]
MNRFGTVRHLIFAMLSVGAIATAASAQLPDRRGENPLNEAVARQKIADQKAEKEVQAAIADAERLLKTNPPKAVQALRTAQVLADSPSLSTETRKRLVESLERKIAAIQGRPLPEAGVKPGTGEKPDPIGVSVKRDRQAAYKNYVAELQNVREGVTRYARYQQAGLKKDADLELARLAKAYPNNPAVLSLIERDNIDTRVSSAVAYVELGKRRIDALNAADAAQTPIGGNGDVEFPKDWKDKTARRLQTIKLTAEEKKIVE